MQRYRNGRYAKQKMTATDRLIVLGLTAFTISCGWYIDKNSIDIAQAYSKTEIAPISDLQLVVKERADDAIPLGDTTVLTTPAPLLKLAATQEPKEIDDMSAYISEAVTEFLPAHKSESLMIMHCLAHRENGHAGNPNGFGDGGLAGGPFQFHEATWIRMRKQMILEGVATDISTRMDAKESTRTTAWAIAHGRALEWGPILRDSKGSNFASCQKPSWYK